jgi:hypothetical protein
VFDLWDVKPYREYGEDKMPTIGERLNGWFGMDRKELEVSPFFLPSANFPLSLSPFPSSI